MSRDRYSDDRRGGGVSVVSVILLVLLLAALVFVVMQRAEGAPAGSGILRPLTSAQAKKQPKQADESAQETQPEETEPVITPEPVQPFEPHFVEETDPANLMVYTEVMVNGESIGKHEYKAPETTASPEQTDGEQSEAAPSTYNYTSPYGEIDFASGEEYTKLEGIITFRGDNYRSGAAYGKTDTLTSKSLTGAWQVSTGSLNDYNGNVWTGSGWTGQPLVVRWPKETRQIMTSMYDSARNKDGLVEIIYATMDGYIYFTDLETGQATRDRLYMGLTYKGAGALDPRGYPILYVGSGVRNMDGQSHVSVVSLIDNKVLYTFGDKDGFALRDWPMYDSSPLVDAETDQLIYPGENGVLYIIHLNTKYDEKAGTLSVEPDNVVKWRYQSTRQTRYVYWLGMESSASAYGGYLFMTDNGANLMCLDLNTLKLVWVKDILDDTNDSPVISVEDGHPYIYVSTAFHYGWRGYEKETIPIYKIDAETGETVWETDYICWTESGVSGGVQGTIAVDDKCIYVPVAKTDNTNGGKLACLDKKTGEIKWEFKTSIYSWGSPIRFDDAAGNRYILYNTGYSSSGYVYLINADTGERITDISLNGNIEASGVVFENWLVIGHRSCRFFGIKLS